MLLLNLWLADRHSQRPGSSRASVASFSIGSPGHEEPSGISTASAGSESRADIQATFEPCPGRFFLLGSRLGGSVDLARARIQRAWTAGEWARAVLAGRVGSPNRSPQLSLPPRIYVVLRSPDLPGPVCFRTSGAYRAALGGRHGDSISHSFPSEAEARVYCDSAGVEFPEIQ